MGYISSDVGDCPSCVSTDRVWLLLQVYVVVVVGSHARMGRKLPHHPAREAEEGFWLALNSGIPFRLYNLCDYYSTADAGCDHLPQDSVEPLEPHSCHVGRCVCGGSRDGIVMLGENISLVNGGQV